MARHRGKHAVVLGGSVAGLLAARVLSDHYERVTLLERDAFPALGEPRKGIPQERHIHGILAGGLLALEKLFPEFSAKLVARGAIAGDVGSIARWYFGGLRIPHLATGLPGLLASRPFLEYHIRELVLNNANITAHDRCDVIALLGTSERVTGVRYAGRDQDTSQRELEADLVVDATGRGSRMPGWLKALAVEAPREECVRVDIGYASCIVRREPRHLDGEHGIVINPTAPDPRAGAALALEGDRYIITLTAYLGETSPEDYPAMLEFARKLYAPGLYDLMRDATPLTTPVRMRYLQSVRRRYERLSHFPNGLLVFGDALCSFNPAYGQGITVAALEARALDRCLERGTERLASRFFREAAQIIDVPWSIVVSGDLQYPGAVGERRLATRLMNAYVLRVIRVAAVDPQVALAFWKVISLVAPPRALFAPAILARVLRRGLKAQPQPPTQQLVPQRATQ